MGTPIIPLFLEANLELETTSGKAAAGSTKGMFHVNLLIASICCNSRVHPAFMISLLKAHEAVLLLW